MGLNHIKTIAPVGGLLQQGADPGRLLIFQGMGSGYRHHFHHLHHTGAGLLHTLTDKVITRFITIFSRFTNS